MCLKQLFEYSIDGVPYQVLEYLWHLHLLQTSQNDSAFDISDIKVIKSSLISKTKTEISIIETTLCLKKIPTLNSL